MMRLALLSLVLLSGCLLPPQRLESPCVGQPASTDGGACPACASDADCAILSNACYETASCVPREGSWAVTLLGCSFQHAPPLEKCGCVSGVCSAK